MGRKAFGKYGTSSLILLIHQLTAAWAGHEHQNLSSVLYRPPHGGFPTATHRAVSHTPASQYAQAQSPQVDHHGLAASSNARRPLVRALSPATPKDYFDELSRSTKPEDDTKWTQLTTRDGKGSPHYLRNLHHGLFESFVPWFNHTERTAPKSYEQMMRSFHSNLIYGADGTPYLGISPSAHGMEQPKDIYPGQFRHEVLRAHPKAGERKYLLDDFGHTWHIRTDVKYPQGTEGLSPRIARLQQAYVDDPGKDKVWEPEPGTPEARNNNGAPAYFFTAQHRQNHFSLDAIRMPGVELPIPVHNQIYQHTILHQYPRHEVKPLILKAMSDTMLELRSLASPKHEHDSATLQRALDLVSRYIYLGAHTHLFESVNMSMIVSQVNYVLSRFNLNGISSGTLDFRAMYEQFPEFDSFVRKELLKSNPRLADIPPPQHDRSPLISILAHIQDHGDIYFPEGQTVRHPFESGKRIEGVMVSSALPSHLKLEYMAHIAGTPDQTGGDTPWTSARTFIGTTGQGRALEGVAFRLLSIDDAQKPLPYRIMYQAKIGDQDWTAPCSDGNFCGTRGKNKGITGLKVWLENKNSTR